ncbi:MAG: YihY/virulence factor BrkB family protein [Chloroflexi bacterium]|nr:YihY/virulence factor BrkB family protein [Chloroflexota bacterium]
MAVERLRRQVDTLRRLVGEATEADLPGAASEVAYSLVLAIFPALIFLSALAGFIGAIVGIANLFDSVLTALGRSLPPAALLAITEPLRDILSTRSGELLSVSIVFTVWAASNGTATMMKAFNRAHGVRETRPFWLYRIVIAIGVTLLLGIVVVAVFVILVFGAVLSVVAVAFLGLDPGLVSLWNWLVWPISAVVLIITLDLFYWVGPDVRQPFRLFTLGAVLAAAGWLVFSFGFRLFIALFANFPATYGTIAGMIVLMLWLNSSALVVIIGAKINAFRADRQGRAAAVAAPAPAPAVSLPPPWPMAAPRQRGLGRYIAAALGFWTLLILVGALREGRTPR